MSVCRPEPRRPDVLVSCASLSEFLPRLLPPSHSQSHVTGRHGPEGGRAGGSSLDVTAETPVAEQATYRPSFPQPPEMAVRSDHTGPRTRAQVGEIRKTCYLLCPSDLPHTHPLRNKIVQDEIIVMRQRMRKFLQLKIHKKLVNVVLVLMWCKY